MTISRLYNMCKGPKAQTEKPIEWMVKATYFRERVDSGDIKVKPLTGKKRKEWVSDVADVAIGAVRGHEVLMRWAASGLFQSTATTVFARLPQSMQSAQSAFPSKFDIKISGGVMYKPDTEHGMDRFRMTFMAGDDDVILNEKWDRNFKIGVEYVLPSVRKDGSKNLSKASVEELEYAPMLVVTGIPGMFLSVAELVAKKLDVTEMIVPGLTHPSTVELVANQKYKRIDSNNSRFEFMHSKYL